MVGADGHVKLIDFGLSKKIHGKHGVTFSFCGSPRYISPEIIQGSNHGQPADYYSLGVVLYEMLSGSSHLNLEDSEQTLKLPESISKSCKLLLKSLLISNPEDRIGFKSGIQEIKSHKWVKNVDWNKVYNKKYKPPFDPISRESNFPNLELDLDFTSLNIFDTRNSDLFSNEELKDPQTAPSNSKKVHKKDAIVIEEPSYIYSSSIDNSLMINQIPAFFTKSSNLIN